MISHWHECKTRSLVSFQILFFWHHTILGFSAVLFLMRDGVLIDLFNLSDVPAPLATKMYHSQGNYRLRLELGQLYHESCAEQLHSYASNTNLNSSQADGLIHCDNSVLHGFENSVTHGAPNNFKLQKKVLYLLVIIGTMS
jgi:hypothetical protein